MTGAIAKVIVAFCLALPLISAQEGNNLLDVETPNSFYYNSPLRQPDSLRSRPYFDFLSTLYRRDATKTNLFRPYLRQRRDVSDEKVAAAAAASTDNAPTEFHIPVPLEIPAEVSAKTLADDRPKRAVVFRPLFVYKQQMVRKEELAKKKRKRVYKRL